MTAAGARDEHLAADEVGVVLGGRKRRAGCVHKALRRVFRRIAARPEWVPGNSRAAGAARFFCGRHHFLNFRNQLPSCPNFTPQLEIGYLPSSDRFLSLDSLL